MTYQDRIVEFIRVPASQLQPNPSNWRTHSAEQRDALSAVLEEIGFAGAVLARRLADGTLQLIDGHLRVETAAEQLVPVLVLDVDDQAADKVLATFDALTSMAGSDSAKLKALLERIEPGSPAIQNIFEHLQSAAGQLNSQADSDKEVEIPPAYQVLVECQDEAQQQSVYEELTASGLECRLMML